MKLYDTEQTLPGGETFREPLHLRGYVGVMGRSSATAVCGFCGFQTRVYLWSLAGSGKRCSNPDCSAILYRHGTVKK